MSDVYFREVYLFGANLSGANLSHASLGSTYLDGANLTNANDAGKEIEAPTLVIHSDTALVPDGARRFFASIPASQKNLHWMTTQNHIAFYDQPEVVQEAALQATEWFKQTLVAANNSPKR